MASLFKKPEVELELLTNVDMLLTVEKGIKGGICQAVHRYAKANNKYMKSHDKNKESSYIRGEWPSGLRRCYKNRKVPGSNPARRSAGLRDPTSLRGSR